MTLPDGLPIIFHLEPLNYRCQGWNLGPFAYHGCAAFLSDSRIPPSLIGLRPLTRQPLILQ